MHQFKLGLSFFLGCIALTVVSICSAGGNFQKDGNLVEKNTSQKNSESRKIYFRPEIDAKEANCIKACIRRNQMAAVGFEVIEGQCKKECKLEKALLLVQSNDSKEHQAGVKILCSIRDKRTVVPLINALKKDLKVRTGLWAWIIPALGESGDYAAVPILVETLKMPDEDWLGREMSARALGNIGDKSAIPALICAAWRADTRDAAVKALAKFKDRRVIPVLLSALQPEEEMETREAAIKGLLYLGGMAVPALITAFDTFGPEHPETQKRLWLCRLLWESGDERALERLRKSMKDPDKAVRKCVQEYVRNK